MILTEELFKTCLTSLAQKSKSNSKSKIIPYIKILSSIELKLNNLNKTQISYETNEVDLKSLNRKVAELEKNFKILSGTINPDQISKELININNNLMNKVGQQEFKEIRDNFAQFVSVINFVKENLSQLQEDHKKLEDDYGVLKRKIDNLANLLKLKSTDDIIRDKENLSSKQLIFDISSSSKYLDLSVFNEFKSQISKELDGLKFAITDLKVIIDDILNRMKSKVEEKDIKELELFLIGKIEELKSACNKKFADKNELEKNLKYLDGQIKQIIEVHIKKFDKGDNWLLAKKPLEGFSCASCEAYIGDLKENNDYISWNKYPMRDPNDKLYRMGNGFSKMLQCLNLEGYMSNNGNNLNLNMNNTHSNMNVPKKKNLTSVDFYKRPKDAPEKKDINLPKVKSNKKNLTSNMTDDDIEVQNENEIVDNPHQPKM